MTTVTAIRDLDIIDIATEIATEATTNTCACGAGAVVSDEGGNSCVTCAIYQWMQPEEVVSVAPTHEERLCVECGIAFALLYDVQTICGLCVEAMTPEEYGASALASEGVERSVLVQTWECVLCDQEYIPTATAERVSGLCSTCSGVMNGTADRVNYGASSDVEYIGQDVGDDPDYLYQDVDDLHGVPVDRAEDTDLSRVVTRVLQPEDFMADGANSHRYQCVYCVDQPYGVPGCPGIAG